MRAVFDSNVFVSAFTSPGSNGDVALTRARVRDCDLIFSVPIAHEVARVLRVKFRLDDDLIIRRLRVMRRAAAEIVRPVQSLSVLADEPDNRILECAIAGKADVIVTGDRGLLDLKSYEGIAIVRLADFLRMFPT